MKYRLVELLQCPCCQGELEVADAQTRPAPGASAAVWPCRRYCARDRTVAIPEPDRCADCGTVDITAGALACRQCGQAFRIVDSVPWLFAPSTGPSGQLLSETVTLYSHVWSGTATSPPPGEAHVDVVEESLDEPVVRGSLGLDAGSGSGGDTAAMASRNPSVEILSLDMSEGVYETKARTGSMPNVHVVRGSVLAIPLKPGLCDFGYSFGVLHHTTDPLGGLREIVRTLKPGSPLSLYLYEDHADNLWKALPLLVVSAFRRVTTKLHPLVLSGLCYGLSPFVVLVFSVPARIMARFVMTKALAERMPFNFGTGPFSIHADLMDRLGAPIEVRYNRDAFAALMRNSGLSVLRITKLARSAGWVGRGVKSSG